LQARLMVETRTNAYHVRRGDFPEDQISVYFTVRQYGSLPSGDFVRTDARKAPRTQRTADEPFRRRAGAAAISAGDLGEVICQSVA